MTPDPDLQQAQWPSARPTAHVLFFGSITDTFGRAAEVTIPGEGCRLSELQRRLGEQTDAGAAALAQPGVRAAVDQQMIIGDVWVRPGQEVAFFSAFSGG